LELKKKLVVIKTHRPQPNRLHPRVLVSLTAPKKCAEGRVFDRHFLGGRFVPPALAAEFNVPVGRYQFDDPICRIDDNGEPDYLF
jgi:hypothetical protein